MKEDGGESLKLKGWTKSTGFQGHSGDSVILSEPRCSPRPPASVRPALREREAAAQELAQVCGVDRGQGTCGDGFGQAVAVIDGKAEGDVRGVFEPHR